jgi:tetratricopeptide (TPR) repeat protein
MDYKNEAEQALKDYTTALKLSNDLYESSRTLNNRATIYENQEKLDLALEEYTKAIEISPKVPVYYSNRARIYQKQEKYELALADYTQAIQIDSKNGFWYYSRGEFLENVMNKPFDALVNYSLAISLDSMEMSYWWQRGQLFSEKLSNQVMAIQDYDQILKIQPNDINSLNWRTIFYHRNNEISKAIEGYKKIINLGDSIKKLENKESDYGWANINLAEIYQSENKTKEALMLYNEALEYNSDDVEYYYWRAWFLTIYMSRYDEAISDFSSAIKLEPKNPNWLLNRSKIYKLKGDLKSAANDINEAIKISKESSSYLAERGNFYSLIGEYDKATKDFKESLKLDSNNRRLYHYVTEDLIRKGKLNDAIDNAMRSVRIFKQDTVSYEQLGRIYYTKNDLQKSLSSYIQAASIMEFNEEYRTIYPHDIQIFLSDVYLKIAEIYKKLNQSDLEFEALQKAESIVIFETRRDRQKMIIEIQERLKTCQN